MFIAGHKTNKRFFKNDYYWKEPNTENSYFAGFIAADGNLNDRNMRLSIDLHPKDRIIVDTFSKAIEYTGRVREQKPTKWHKNGSVGIYLYNADKYFEDLTKWYNITPRKSLTLQPPNITDPNMIKAYIVGYFDGDGWRGISNPNKSNSLRMTFLGTQQVLQWIKHNLDAGHTDIHRCNGDSRAYRLNYNKLAVLKIYNDLMSIDVPRLERKWKHVDI